MPFYEYQCAACGHHHEELQKVTDRALRKCPACGRPSLKRLVSAPVFRLKGGGWYETDFKHEKEEKRNLAGEKEPAAADSAPSKESKDEKPAATPEPAKADAKEAPERKKPEPGPAASRRRAPSARRKGVARRRRR
jgi:putative FmdB family regulatory protein